MDLYNIALYWLFPFTVKTKSVKCMIKTAALISLTAVMLIYQSKYHYTEGVLRHHHGKTHDTKIMQ